MKAILEFDRGEGGYWRLSLEPDTGRESARKREEDEINKLFQFIEEGRMDGRVGKRAISDGGSPTGAFHVFLID